VVYAFIFGDNGFLIRGVAIFAKASLGHSIPIKQQKLRDHWCPRRPRFVRVASFRPNKGSKHWLSHDLTPFRDALQVFSASFENPPGASASGTKNLHFAKAPFPRFSAFEKGI